MGLTAEYLSQIKNRLEALSDKDLEVLRALKAEAPIYPIQVSADLFILPRLVVETLDHLSELQFIAVDPETHSTRLSEHGKAAQILSNLKSF